MVVAFPSFPAEGEAVCGVTNSSASGDLSFVDFSFAASSSGDLVAVSLSVSGSRLAFFSTCPSSSLPSFVSAPFFSPSFSFSEIVLARDLVVRLVEEASSSPSFAFRASLFLLGMVAGASVELLEVDVGVLRLSSDPVDFVGVSPDDVSLEASLLGLISVGASFSLASAIISALLSVDS